MSYNPCRGASIGFNKALKSSERYRVLYHYEVLYTWEGLYKKSKYLYFWWVNRNKTCKVDILELMSDHELDIFKVNLSKLFPKLADVLKDSGVVA